MYLGGSYMLAVNVRRSLMPGRPAIRLVFSASAAAPLLLMLIHDGLAQAVYFFEGLVCCGALEGYLYVRQRRSGPRVQYRWLGRYWLVFLVAFGFWWMDKARLLCSAGNHWISGHGIWHLLDALALFFVYLFYRQFDVLRFREEHEHTQSVP